MFKKVAGIISLLIMVITQILTPYAYAVSGDVIDIDEKNERIIEEQEQETNEQETKDQDEDKTEYITEENMETVSFEEDQYSGDDELSLTGDDVCAQKGDNELTGTNGLLTGNIFTGSEVVGNEEILSNLSGTYLTGVDNNPGFAENQIENKEYLSGNEDDDFISNEIYGSGEYDGVRVEVYADTGLFQSGTELVIEPIKWFKLRSLKNDLIEEKEEITKDSAIVAFNISFIYSGEEVQPLSGKTVSVTFNYEKNEDLKQAEEDESQEIKIYHINDKDEEGNKLDENEVEKIDIVENNEGEIVVEAENFSIYTIVTQVAEEGPLAENENQLANFVYGEISIARPDDLSSADYPKEGFTIMDRNLGAITTGAGAGASTGSYGYHYQWGNNYGFDANKDKSEMITSSVKVDVSGLTEYNSGTFIISNITNDSNARTDTWMKSDNNNLWHGDKIQGPCPNGWHIPSVEELNHLLIYWAKSNNIGWTLNSNLVKLNGGHSKVSNDLYIPYAGARNYDASFLNRGNLGIFWSYSINGSNKLPYDFFTTNKNNPNETYIRNSDGRIRGISVRCFKDTYSGTGDMFTVTYDFNGGSGSVVNQMVKSGDIAERPIDPIKSGYDFKGWYISGTNTQYDFSKKVTDDKELYAKYREICGEGYVSDGEQCILQSSVTYLKKGGDFKSILTFLAGSNPINIIERSDNEPVGQTGLLSTSGLPVIAWYELSEDGTGTIYYKTDATTIFMNSDSSYMFNNFRKLKRVNLDGFNSSKVTTMQLMFDYCFDLEELDVSNRDTSNVTNMANMFSRTQNLKHLNLSNFDTSNVTTMYAMFLETSVLEELDLSSFDTSSVKNMSNMFVKSGISTLIFGDHFDTSSVTNMSSMFSTLANLQELDLSGFDTSSVTDMSSMFWASKKLNRINLSSFSTSSVINMKQMFEYCNSLEDLDVSSFDTSNVTNMANMFARMHKLKHLNLSNFDTSKVTSMSEMFLETSVLEELDLSSFDTSLVSNMTKMFLNSGISTLIFGDHFDTSSVTNMSSMFSTLANLQELDLSGFDTSAVTDMSSMFWSSRKLNKINLSGFNTSSVTNMKQMFEYCYALEELDVSSFDTSSVTDMSNMFSRLHSLKHLNLSNFDTSKVTSMKEMFLEGYLLEELDLSSFDTSSVINMSSMFKDTKILKYIYVSPLFTGDQVTSSATMFSNTYKIIGGNGTKYDSSNINISYAHVDDENNSGYFTDPSHFAVSFLSSTGLEIAKQWISTGSTIDELNDPSKEYEYYTDSNLTIPYNTGTELYAYTGIYVKVTSKFKVEFNTMGGTPEVDSQWISSGGTATEIDESLLPKKEGYLFSGWYISGTDTKFDFSQAITEDKSLYAKWNLKICVTYAPIQGTNNIKITGLLGEEGCERNLTIPSHIDGKPVTYIEGGFKDIKILEGRLTIPDTVTSIGGNAFWNAFKTTDQTLENTLVLGTGLESIGKAAFRNNNFTGQLVLPDTLTGGISETAFYNNKFNGELVIPRGITYIDAKSFENNKFTKVDFSKTNNLKSIWGEAFRGMNSLEGELRIPDSVESIHGSAFWGAFKTTNQTKENTLKLGTGLKYIYDHAFRDNNFTGELILPDLLTGTIGKAAFYNNKFNGELIIPKGITKILEEAFRYNKFNRIDWSKAKKLESIGNNSFREMYSLEGELRIPDTVTSVGFSSFWRAFKTTNQTLENKLILGTGLESIGENAFRGNKFTGELILPDILTGVIGRAAFYDNSFTGELIIPKGITEISRESFRYNNLTKINFEKTENLKTIGQDSFRENKIALLTDIPSSVETIGDSAFYSNNIDEIDFISGNVTIGGNAFCNNGTVNGYQNLATINTASPDCVNWQGKYPYNVTYVTYGGEPSTGEIVLYGDTITNILPIKTGYEFKGWYLTGDIFFPNTIPITGDLTLYAKFQKDIVFKIIGNGNKILSGSEEVDEYTLTGTVFNTDDKYSFTFPQIRPNIRTPYSIGYSTGEDIHTASYHSGDTVTLTGNMTYYAQSKQIYSNHIGTFITGTGVESLGPTNKQKIELDCTPETTYNGNRDDSCTIHTPVINVKSGYNSAKYYQGTNEYNQDTDMVITNDQSFIAIANLITYDINYILNGGELSEQKLSYTTEEGFSIANPTRTGYEFLGWTGTTLTDITKNLYINTGTYGDLTLYANWIPNIYKIIYTHSGEQTEQLINYDEEVSLNPNTFEKEGYLFSGWYDETYDVRYRDTETIKNLTTISGDTFTLKAEWNPINYTVTFHSNTGEDETLVQLFTYDEGDKSLAKNIFINTGYIFKSWNTEELGTGIKYEDEEEVSNLTSVNNTTINLYAQWNKISKVEFKDGENLLTGYIVESGTEIELPENPSKPGYEFVKWNSLPEDMIVRGEDIVITAEWKTTAPKEQQAAAGGGRRIENSKDQEHHSADNQSGNTGDNKTNNTTEDMQSVYEWAYQHNITTLPTLERANPDGTVKRGHLAKMIVNYANNVLGREIPEKIPAECSWNDRKTDRESQEIKEYAVKACALGLMGLDMQKFLPNMEVTRAQFGTIISRLLWGKKYAGGTPYYRKHLNALKENNIMTQIENPEKRVEIRKRVWLMLMRSSKNN